MRRIILITGGARSGKSTYAEKAGAQPPAQPCLPRYGTYMG